MDKDEMEKAHAAALSIASLLQDAIDRMEYPEQSDDLTDALAHDVNTLHECFKSFR